MFMAYFLLIWGSLGYFSLLLFSAAQGSPGDPAPLGEEAAFERAGVCSEDRCSAGQVFVLQDRCSDVFILFYRENGPAFPSDRRSMVSQSAEQLGRVYKAEFMFSS